ncbi:sigma-54-dependent Fis family transcriptional regulator [Aquabacterium sp.]|uniref:sigma-54 interaction domain-containing protein n=1 Tax=Aquabacterium sp. TaxID=1872578 RepID=UPI0026083610|nr:sigma-54-dependent Fis family transcriptional regulator [Aquabacterium sp.]MDD2977480.1 sigma-54-dependent Fis family transcriptional regulator [Aquabacterium sp.]
MSEDLPALMSYLDGLPEPHIVFDMDYRIVSANAAYLREYAPGQDVRGQTCYEVSHRFQAPCDQAGESCPKARALLSGQRERVLHLHHTPGGEAYVNIELSPLKDRRGRIRYFIEKMEPIAHQHGTPVEQGMVGRAPAFRSTLEMALRVAPTAASVLLLGESGTGKELMAKAIHEASPRAKAPFVVVECASLSETLFESELFGHEKGAFTGATSTRVGLAESANGGTLFLDEVGDIPLSMQVKLLRLLETGTFRRVGSSDLRHTNVRVIAATHRSLRGMIEQQLFREDLYHRLSTFPIRLPPLRERHEDIPLLADTLLARVAPTRHLNISSAGRQRLMGHPFTGNIRELRNVMERAALFCDGDVIELTHIEQALAADAWASGVAVHAGTAFEATPASVPSLSPLTKRQAMDRATLLEAVRLHRGSRAELAASMGISERSLYRKLKAFGA